MATNETPVAQIERAWHRLMHSMGKDHPERVNSGKIVLKVLHDRMRAR